MPGSGWSSRVAGFITVDDPDADSEDRRYRLDGHAEAVFLHPADPSHVSPLADMVVSVGQTLGATAEAYRNGDGVSFAAYGKGDEG